MQRSGLGPARARPFPSSQRVPRPPFSGAGQQRSAAATRLCREMAFPTVGGRRRPSRRLSFWWREPRLTRSPWRLRHFCSTRAAWKRKQRVPGRNPCAPRRSFTVSGRASPKARQTPQPGFGHSSTLGHHRAGNLRGRNQREGRRGRSIRLELGLPAQLPLPRRRRCLPQACPSPALRLVVAPNPSAMKFRTAHAPARRHHRRACGRRFLVSPRRATDLKQQVPLAFGPGPRCIGTTAFRPLSKPGTQRPPPAPRARLVVQRKALPKARSCQLAAGSPSCSRQLMCLAGQAFPPTASAPRSMTWPTRLCSLVAPALVGRRWGQLSPPSRSPPMNLCKRSSPIGPRVRAHQVLFCVA